MTADLAQKILETMATILAERYGATVTVTMDREGGKSA